MKVLITGASGFVGNKLLAFFSAKGDEVLGTYYRSPSPNLTQLDVTDASAVEHLFNSFKPELVIHAGAMGRPDDCERNPELAQDVNVGGTWNVASATRQLNAFLVFPSSIFVFDGKKGGAYNESDSPNPINVYGATKVQAEEIVRTLPYHLILRSDMIYGYNGEGVKNGLAGLILNHRNPVLLDNINTRQPLFLDDLAPAINTLINHEKRGTFHLAGAERITQYDLGLRISELAGNSLGIEPRPPEQMARRPKNSTIDPTKALDAGITFTPLDSSIRIIGDQLSNNVGPEGRPRALPGLEK